MKPNTARKRRPWSGQATAGRTPKYAAGQLRPDVEAKIRDMREAIRREEGRGGQCGFVVEWIASNYGWEGRSGVYLAPTGEPIGDHAWTVLPDGAILDPTADQFCEGHDIRLVLPDDPEHARYRWEWTEDFNPGIADDPEIAAMPWNGKYDAPWSRSIRKARGDRWWLDDRRHVAGYKARERAYGKARRSAQKLSPRFR